MATERNRLVGRWIHAHEEDTADGMVFRPAEHELPPSRGRMRLELRDDGTLIETSPGPVDRTEGASGQWQLTDDDELVLATGGQRRVVRVLAADPGRLVISRGARPSSTA
jgi:hypothetical protein